MEPKIIDLLAQNISSRTFEKWAEGRSELFVSLLDCLDDDGNIVIEGEGEAVKIHVDAEIMKLIVSKNSEKSYFVFVNGRDCVEYRIDDTGNLVTEGADPIPFDTEKLVEGIENLHKAVTTDTCQVRMKGRLRVDSQNYGYYSVRDMLNVLLNPGRTSEN